MTPRQIKARLKGLGLTQGDLCRMWKRPKATVSFLVNRKLVSAELESKLARLFGMSLEQFRNGTME